MSNSFTRLIIPLLCASLLPACTSDHAPVCSIQCQVDSESPAADTLLIRCYEEPYGRLRTIYAGKPQPGTLTLSEICYDSQPKIAMLNTAGDTHTHYFIIEPSTITITLSKTHTIIAGSKSTHRLITLRQRIKALTTARAANRARYLRALSDSTITAKLETKCNARDSLLNDSLQHILTAAIDGSTAVSKIARQEFSHLLTATSWRKLEHKGTNIARH